VIPLDKDPDAPDRLVVASVLAGERDRFGVIVRRYERTVFRLALTYLGNREEAADASQEIFLKAFRSLASCQTDRPFLPWLYSIALNTLRTRHGRASRMAKSETTPPDFEETFADPADADPLDQAIRGEQARLVREGVSRLPQRLRAPVVLYYFEGLSVEETGEVLGLGVPNVKSRLFRARRRLAGMFIGKLG